MKEQKRVLAGAMLGALAGGVMAFLAFTDRGRALLRQADTALDDVSGALDQFRAIVREVDGALQDAGSTSASTEGFGQRQDSSRGY